LNAEKTRILCIEDEPELLEDLGSELREAGYEVAEASSGMEGLAAIFDGAVDLAICDIRLPGIDGLDVLSEVKKRNEGRPSPPFVMLSAFCDQDLKERARLMGASEFLVKPVDYDELLSVVDKVLRQKDRPS